MPSSVLSSVNLPVKPLKRSFDKLKAGHTGTSQLKKIIAPNLLFPGFEQEIKDVGQMIQEGGDWDKKL